MKYLKLFYFTFIFSFYFRFFLFRLCVSQIFRNTLPFFFSQKLFSDMHTNINLFISVMTFFNINCYFRFLPCLPIIEKIYTNNCVIFIDRSFTYTQIPNIDTLIPNSCIFISFRNISIFSSKNFLK